MVHKFLFTLFILINNLSFEDEEKITLELINFSDAYNDFSPSLYKDGILFVSDRDMTSTFYKLYFSDFKNPPQEVPIINEKYHIGQSFYDPKKDLIYVTKSNNEGHSNKINLAVFKGVIENFKISELEKLNFCKAEYTYAFAQIFNDKLFISTNEFGSFSIVSYELINDKWINPEIIFSDNFPIANPIIKDENTILFSSKREGGLGGFDLYKIEKVNNNWKNLTNLKQFNSEFDELSIIYINEKEGFISSNRLNKTDHIFKFRVE